MGEIGYRVAVSKVGDGEIAMELFETRSDATAYMESFLGDEDNMLEGLPGAYTVTMDELFRGSWVPVSKKLVRV